ncbi:MAG TPA: hypothetical protein VK126_03220 [Nitrososphaerales archaeon]|nr:hypothetical protein [Nitrososphaerales archaeon]
MKTAAKRILPLTALAILLISMAPLAYASTLKVTLNPNTKLAKIDSVSTTKIVFTYPATSTMATYLKGVSSSLKLNGSFAGGTSGVEELQSSFPYHDGHISVKNMTVSLDYSTKGNATALVVNKMTHITAWVSGVFSVVNHTVKADLRWRSFMVQGAMDVELENHPVDINLVGSAMEYSLGSHQIALGFLSNSFGGGDIWSRPTLNFSALNSPLSSWTKNYNSLTNTTTFSKTISGQTTFSASINYNGQKYSLSAVSDPSGEVAVQGYANASGDSITIGPTPAYLSLAVWEAAAAIIVAGIAVGYLALRSRSKARTVAPPVNTLAV